MLPTSQIQNSTDGTLKFLWNLIDGQRVESVLLRRVLGRGTLCVSSQAGCAMSCDFCLTGEQGLKRNLSVAEILKQVDEARLQSPVTNIVFMGMGEPLHNFDAVTETCQRLLKDYGFSRRKITISTSGIVPKIRELSTRTPVRLAVSLNAPDDELRSRLMPVNHKWGISELLQAAEHHAYAVKMPVMLEYILLQDINDSLAHAEALLRLIQNRPFQVNLIPFNEYPGARFKRPDPARIKAFQHALVSRAITTTVRQSGGPDILAACGQLSGAMI